MERSQGILRRSLLIAGAAGAIAPSFGSAQPSVLTKPIPSTGEALPLFGLGTWITFNVGKDIQARDSSGLARELFSFVAMPTSRQRLTAKRTASGLRCSTSALFCGAAVI
jgi:hypothetical protein